MYRHRKLHTILFAPVLELYLIHTGMMVCNYPIRPSWSFISLRTGFKFNIQNAEMLKTLKYIGVKKCYIYNIDGQNL